MSALRERELERFFETACRVIRDVYIIRNLEEFKETVFNGEIIFEDDVPLNIERIITKVWKEREK